MGLGRETSTNPTEPQRRRRGRSAQDGPRRGFRSCGLGRSQCLWSWDSRKDCAEVGEEGAGRQPTGDCPGGREGGQLPAALDFCPMEGSGGADPARQTGVPVVMQGRG